jgi:hypothetical protein
LALNPFHQFVNEVFEGEVEERDAGCDDGRESDDTGWLWL